MELEEAIKILKYQLANRNTDIYTPINYDAMEVVLNQLDSLKFKYQARKDRTDTIIKKQEKMIEYMVNWINDQEDPFEGCHENGKCEDESIPCKECIKQYFEKKAEGK